MARSCGTLYLGGHGDCGGVGVLCDYSMDSIGGGVMAEISDLPSSQQSDLEVKIAKAMCAADGRNEGEWERYRMWARLHLAAAKVLWEERS